MLAKMSKPFESLNAKICVMVTVIRRKIPNVSKENIPIDEDIIKNQKLKPIVTVSALNLGEENSILDRIDKCDQTRLCQCGYTN